MSRPPKLGLDYFPHDTDAVNDEKIEAMRALFGNDGYAFYFIMLERIYRTENQELIVSGGVSEAETMQILSRKVAVTVQKLEEMLRYALKVGLFSAEKYENDHVLTSKGIKNRAQPILDKRARMKEFYEKEKVSAGVSAAEMGAESTQSKVKESIEKERILSLSPPPVGDALKNKPRTKPTFPHNTGEYQLAKMLFSNILEVNPNHRMGVWDEQKRETHLQLWAYQMDLLIRVDKRDVNEISKVIRWATHDSFWGRNILSGEKLRFKYDELVGKMENKPFTQKTDTRPRVTKSIDDVLKEKGIIQ